MAYWIIKTCKSLASRNLANIWRPPQNILRQMVMATNITASSSILQPDIWSPPSSIISKSRTRKEVMLLKCSSNRLCACLHSQFIITITPGAHPAKMKLQNVETQHSLPCETYRKLKAWLIVNRWQCSYWQSGFKTHVGADKEDNRRLI